MTRWPPLGGTADLLERDGEVAQLADAVDRAGDGDARAVVIEGDAGLGKTALLDVAAELSGERKFSVFRARGGSLERMLGWGVARQLFEVLVVRAAPTSRRSLLRGSASLAGPLLGLSGEQPSMTNDSKFEHGLYWLVSNLSERTPVALLIDDAHWCDEATLAWWLYLLRRSERLPLLMILAARRGEPGSPTDLLDLIADEPIVRTVALNTLDAGATLALIQRAYGSRVDDEFGLACHAWTGGNPLFVTELATELAAEGVEPVEAAAPRVRSLTPRGASRVTLLRLSRLSERALLLARAVAVLDPAADRWLASALIESREDDVGPAVDELVQARILSPGNPLAFVHPLLGGIVYDDLPTARRAVLHRRAARLLVDVGGEPGRVAAHLLRTNPAGDPWVVDQLLAAADVELEHGSPSTAVRLLRRAHREPPAPDTLASVLFALGRAEARSGDDAGFHTLGDALSKTADAHTRAEIALALGQLSVRAGQPETAIRTVKEEAESLGWRDSDLRLRLEALLITLARFAGGQLGLISERQAVVRDRAAGETHGGRLIAGQLAWSLSARSQSAERTVELARTALADGIQIEEAPDTPEAWVGPIHVLTVADQLEEADAHWMHVLRLAERHGSEAAFAAASCYRSATAYLGGRLAEAELYARDCLRTTSSSLSLLHRIGTAHLAQALVDRGVAAAARAAVGIDGVPERSPRTRATQPTLAAGRALIASGRLGDGVEVLLEAGRLATASGVLNPAWLAWRSEAALALHRRDQADEAARLCDEELELARRFGAPRSIGVALRARGLVMGGEAGVELLQDAVETLAASQARLEHARALVSLGGAWRRSNKRAQAREPLSEGLRIAEQCGAELVASEAREELRAAGSRPRAVFRTGTDALTASERRVCELAASGKSNREIAQLLFVTRPTVESHLHSAYRRLDIGSRNELAAALVAER
jgi:DNA-binding CsgD family transcriptional regulator